MACDDHTSMSTARLDRCGPRAGTSGVARPLDRVLGAGRPASAAVAQAAPIPHVGPDEPSHEHGQPRDRRQDALGRGVLFAEDRGEKPQERYEERFLRRFVRHTTWSSVDVAGEPGSRGPRSPSVCSPMLPPASPGWPLSLVSFAESRGISWRRCGRTTQSFGHNWERCAGQGLFRFPSWPWEGRAAAVSPCRKAGALELARDDDRTRKGACGT